MAPRKLSRQSQTLKLRAVLPDHLITHIHHRERESSSHKLSKFTGQVYRTKKVYTRPISQTIPVSSAFLLLISQSSTRDLQKLSHTWTIGQRQISTSSTRHSRWLHGLFCETLKHRRSFTTNQPLSVDRFNRPFTVVISQQSIRQRHTSQQPKTTGHVYRTTLITQPQP